MFLKIHVFFECQVYLLFLLFINDSYSKGVLSHPNIYAINILDMYSNHKMVLRARIGDPRLLDAHEELYLVQFDKRVPNAPWRTLL